MKLRLPQLCLILACAGVCRGEAPRKQPLLKYQSLWTNSPFTAKPEQVAGPVYNPLQDYVLLGVSPIQEGYRVTILNRKKPNDEPVVVESHRPADGIEIKEVKRKEGDPFATTVRLERGGATGEVGFEDKFLTLNKVAAAPPPKTNPGNPQAAAGQMPNQQDPQRPPRRRVIPPGTNVQIPASSGNQNGERIERVLNLPNNSSNDSGNRSSGRFSGR